MFFVILPLSIIPLIIISNVYYLILDIVIFMLKITLKDNIRLGSLQRDINKALYKDLFIFNNHYHYNQPLILWTYKRVPEYKHKSLLY